MQIIRQTVLMVFWSAWILGDVSATSVKASDECADNHGKNVIPCVPGIFSSVPIDYNRRVLWPRPQQLIDLGVFFCGEGIWEFLLRFTFLKCNWNRGLPKWGSSWLLSPELSNFFCMTSSCHYQCQRQLASVICRGALRTYVAISVVTELVCARLHVHF